MANTYTPEQLGIKPPAGGFQTGGWYQGRQYWNGVLSEPGVINPYSNQQGAGTTVSPEVNAASAALQGVSPQQFESYLQQQRQASANITPQGSYNAPGATTGTPTGVAPSGTGVGIQAPATIDLPSLYKGLYEKSGVNELQEQYSNYEKDFIEAKAKINDNPFLSEATRVGRIAKIESLFAERTANILNQIATKKADVEMQLNLATKQYDINTQAAKDALNQFNTLLASGALDNASGQDIANLTMSTGLSSTMIQSAINANKAKNIQTSTISFDDGTNQGFAVINSQTGEIISKQVVAASKPKAASVVDQKIADEQQTQANAIADVQAGSTLRDIINHYVVAGGLSLEDAYRIYNSYSPYGQAEESLEDVKEGRFAV